MQIEILVRMANDIGAFFAAEPDQNEAARSVSAHLKRYWDPRMRRQIAEHYQAGGEGLSATVKTAIGMMLSN